MNNSPLQSESRWRMWQRWTLASTGGALIAVLLYAWLPRAITAPEMVYGDYDYVAAPWRYLLINGVLYGALSGAQWLLLRRYVTDAWWWIVATVGWSAVIYPGTIWWFSTVQLGGIAELIWSAGTDYPYGFGGPLFAITGQWLILRQWVRFAWLWLVITPFLGGCTLVGVVVLLAPLDRWVGLRVNDTIFDFVAWTIFSALSGFVMATLLSEYRRPTAVASELSPSQPPR